MSSVSIDFVHYNKILSLEFRACLPDSISSLIFDFRYFVTGRFKKGDLGRAVVNGNHNG